MFSAYPFNHSWPNFQTLKEIAQHQYIDSLFSRNHIKTHTFWTTTRNKGDWKKGPDFDHQSFLNEEQQFYDLTKHLLVTYGSMNKTFVYQNWEGDWMLRGQGVLWETNPSIIPDDVEWDIEGMARMFRARQRGTERARNEHSSATAKVFHGIEFNKLWWNDNGTRKTMMESNIPCVIADVASKVRLDLTSWSAYDGGWTNAQYPHGHAMWKGLEMARYFTSETGELHADFPVQIGEFAINENPRNGSWNNYKSKGVIENRYGRYIGVALSLGIPNFYLWNLYCSGQQGAPEGSTWQKGVQYEDELLYEWMDGKWLIEPDGTWGHAANFLMQQWNNTFTANNGSWNSASNWSKGRVPITSDNVFIPADKTALIDTSISNFSSLNNEGVINVNTEGILKTSNNLVNNGTINLDSNNDNSSVLMVEGNTVVGNITYNRNLGTENWYLVSSPVAGETYDNAYVNANSLAINGTNNAIGSYVPADNIWSYMQTDDDAASFNAGQGYSVRRETDQGAGDISFTGTINTASVETSSLDTGFNLIGNPYTSFVNSATFLGATTSSNLDQTQIWLWNQAGGTYEVKIFGEAWILAPGQGFFVNATSTGTVTFDESNQAAQGTDTFLRTNSWTEVKLLMTDGEKNRFTKLYFTDNATTGFDAGWEGEVFGGIQNEIDVFTHLVEESQGKKYQVQSLPLSDLESSIIPVGVTVEAGKTATFSIENTNVPSNINVYIEDKQDNSFTLLEEDANFSFTPENNLDGIGRFYIHTTTSSLSADDFGFNNTLSIYTSSRENLRIVGVQNGTANIQLYNILGKEVLRDSFEGNGVNDIALPKLNSGIYIVKITTETGTTNKKIIIN
jgi:hypothetical protein